VVKRVCIIQMTAQHQVSCCNLPAVLTARLSAFAQEVALIGMLAYLSYLCGELLGISGIVSLFCCGVVTSHYVSAPPFCIERQKGSCTERQILVLLCCGMVTSH
jgi:NhaP-type Na+/H+ or K+/H+ antiporter